MSEADMIGGAPAGRGPVPTSGIHSLRRSALSAVVLSLVLTGCVTSAAAPPAGAPSTSPAGRAVAAQFADRTFFAATQGNLRGSVYFAANGTAVQAAQDRGVRRLSWSAESNVEGLKGPAICVAGGFHDISGDAVAVQRAGQSRICLPAASLARFRSSKGNVLGLGTIIQ